MILDNPFSLENKTILITGASSGIGRQCAISCSNIGAKVILMGRNTERLENTIKYMRNSNIHLFSAIDLTNYDDVNRCIKSIISEIGQIDGVIHCAGISTTLPLKNVSIAKLDEYFQSNVFSAYNLTREICKIGNLNKSGASIVFLSSIM